MAWSDRYGASDPEHRVRSDEAGDGERSWLHAEADVVSVAAGGASLRESLDRLARHLEQLMPGSRCSVLLLGEDARLYDGAGPSLPDEYRAAIDGLRIGPDVGSCGAAAHHGTEVVVEDIATDRRWDRFRDLALEHGLRACWSVPVYASSGRVVGTFAVYHGHVRAPTPDELETVWRLGDLAAVLIDRDRAERLGQRLAATVDRIDDGVAAVDLATGSIAYVNRILSEWIGRAREELVGSEPTKARFGLDAGDVARFSELDAATIEERSVALSGSRPDEERVCDARFQHIDGWLVGVYRDVTRERDAELRLRERERLYRSIAEGAQDVIYRVRLRPEVELEYLNASGAETLGVPLEDARRDPQLMLQGFRAEDFAALDAARRSDDPEAWPVEVRWTRPDGEHVWLLVRETPIFSPEGELVAVHGVGADYTRRHREEQALRQALDHERAASQDLRTVADMKAAFLQAVSHELRTPLTALSGFATTLRRHHRELDAERVEELLARTEHNANRLTQLLTDLLDVDRLSRSRVEAARTPTPVARLVGNVVAELDATTHPVEVAGPRLTVPIDAAKVERVVDNLIRNAQKHTPPGTPIRVTWEPEGDGVLLVVEDTGPGVPTELRERVFEPFEQTPASSVGHSPGAGIGLSLVARIAELHGGRAWVTEGPGGVGARFHVLLPGS